MALKNEFEDINWSEPFETSASNIQTEDSPPIPADCIKRLHDSFGHSQFRKMQWKIISSIMYDARDNCVIMATGYGKSLCYQFPSVYRDTITIVVSPLISLMQDQVAAMCFYNLKACFLGSAQTNRDTVNEIIDRQYNIVYVTPEYITSPAGKYLIERIKTHLTLIAIDEAHCISKWGHDFRSAYRNLSILRKWCSSVPILAMTATATSKVRDDIIESLDLKDPQIVSTGFDRPNLEFIVQSKTNVWDDIGKHIQSVKVGSIIVYCITRRVTEDVASEIASHGHHCAVYHAGLSLKKRQETHDNFIRDRIRVVVATIAFGMGINKPDVRLVIHYGVSKDIESYYQEVGRAGRDGLPAQCLLFHHRKDYALHHRIQHKSNPNYSQEQVERLIKAMKQYIETGGCRRRFILNYFGEDCKDLPERIDCCDNCRKKIRSPAKSLNLYSKYQDLDTDGRLDITEDSKIVLKLLQDMSRYGLRKAILVLRGSKNKDVPASYTNHIAFGKLKHRSDKWIQAVVNSLVEMQILALEDVHDSKFSYTRCLLTIKGKVWLSGKGEESPIKVIPNDEFIKLLKPRVISAPKNLIPIFDKTKENQPSSSFKTSVPQRPTISLPNNVAISSPSSKPDIYRPLLKVRARLASLYDAMPYLVASTKALEQLAIFQPTTMEELRNIRLDGYSEEKTQRFGPVFLKAIKDYQQKLEKISNGKIGQESKNVVDTSALIHKLPPKTEKRNHSLDSTQESNYETIQQSAPEIIEIESDIENAVFDNFDSDDDAQTSNGNTDLDLLLEAAIKSGDFSENNTKNIKQTQASQAIKKKPSTAFEYESDESCSDAFDGNWDLEIDESDLNKISQEVEENFGCNLQNEVETSSSNFSQEIKKPLSDVEVPRSQIVNKERKPRNIERKLCNAFEFDDSLPCETKPKQERKPRIIERKVREAFEFEDDSESETETKPVSSPKKRVLPSWMQSSQKRKR